MNPIGIDQVDALREETCRLSEALAATRFALSAAESRERSRVADDLHDILGHALEVIAFRAELAERKLVAQPWRVNDELTEIQRTARSAISDLRSLALRRRSTDLGRELTHTISLFCTAGIDVQVFGDPGDVAQEARDPLARALREAVTNIVRHATPTHCMIQIQQNDDEAFLTVENDGVPPIRKATGPRGTGLTRLSRSFSEQNGRVVGSATAGGSFYFRAAILIGATFPPETSSASL